MANHGYMSINGKSQGLISAGCSTQDSIGNKCQEGHRDEIMVMSFNHNMLNTGNVRASTHGPVVITKSIDKSSPLLAVALSNREELNMRHQLLSNFTVWSARKILHRRYKGLHHCQPDRPMCRILSC